MCANKEQLFIACWEKFLFFKALPLKFTPFEFLKLQFLEKKLIQSTKLFVPYISSFVFDAFNFIIPFHPCEFKVDFGTLSVALAITYFVMETYLIKDD